MLNVVKMKNIPNVLHNVKPHVKVTNKSLARMASALQAASAKVDILVKQIAPRVDVSNATNN